MKYIGCEIFVIKISFTIIENLLLGKTEIFLHRYVGAKIFCWLRLSNCLRLSNFGDSTGELQREGTNQKGRLIQNINDKDLKDGFFNLLTHTYADSAYNLTSLWNRPFSYSEKKKL